MRLIILILILTITEVISKGCSIQVALPKLRRAIYDFTLELAERVAEDTKNHFVLTPYSLWATLDAVTEGATNETLAQNRKILQTNPYKCFRNKYLELIKYMDVHSSNVEKASARLIVLRQSLTERINKSYINNLIQSGAVDYMYIDLDDIDYATRNINSHIALKTDTIIDRAIDDYNNDVFESDMILVDADYFKGKWKVAFDSVTTGQFSDEDGTDISNIEMMHRIDNFNVTDMNILKAKVLEIPFDDKVSMLLFLTKDGVKISDLLQNFKKTNIRSVIATYEKNKTSDKLVNLTIPRFSIITSMELSDYLIDMGLNRIFDKDLADFDVISDSKLYVENFFHKTEIIVDDAGVDYVVGDKGTAELDFDASRPFVFIVYDRVIGTILHFGAFSNPNSFK